MACVAFFKEITFIIVQFTCSKTHLFQVYSLVSVAQAMYSLSPQVSLALSRVSRGWIYGVCGLVSGGPLAAAERP